MLIFLVLLIPAVRSQSVPADLETELESFNIPLKELDKDAKPVTTLNEQCSRFVNHYRYYCRSSNIATYNEEIRIICERYRTYCSDRVYPSVNHIRRQTAFWKQSGLPVASQRALTTCYSHCKETDPVCINACECLHLQWMMDYSCYPGMVAPAGPNCQRWYAKCRAVWKPLPNYTPADRGLYGAYAPPPIVKGQFYGYDAAASHTTFDKPRDHGVSFYRGTNTVLVNWPEGKVSGGTTQEVPFAGINVGYGLYDIGFPNLARGMKEFTRDNPDPLNPGTGRYRYQM